MRIRILLTILYSCFLANCEEVASPAKFTVSVVDDEGKPIPQVQVEAWTYSHWEPGEAFGKDVADKHTQASDQNGLAVFNFPIKSGTFSTQVENGNEFYKSRAVHYEYEKVVSGRWFPENPTITYVLKKKKNSISLCAKNLTEGLKVPVLGVKCGYDFEVGDWTAPYGKGVETDIYFKVIFHQESNGDFDSEIEVTFPNQKDGLIFFDQDRNEGSELISDHMAPTEGYQASKTLKRFQKDGKITSEINQVSGNYYLRLRTRVDENGNIKEANYAKIYGDFMNFTYYFNPTVNDRNLEFDLQKNLIKGEDVTRP